ncbi:ribosomal protein S18-alanine N-acetyltransferase [Plantactinospora sp. KBS50]|uniref:ribosomal protein S18-alanine N-acetyltransferase n=1 Tax=Plantactinospora sp. KBS50 TaxID=2024580 RepID=UPI000BAABA34|nr:ribosomal protein S18-alanine N-acetyltransferase [Plantactinospora sp. KBS50]ASW57426.1 ribosomal-protein-alanine N-acetyltransferase [Plantactinospora sp. KBS50]
MRWWHIEAVLPMEDDLFGVERWSAAMFWNELANGHHYVVALPERGEQPVGYAGLALQPPAEAWVQNIAVRRDRQRSGVGRALLAELLRTADDAGVRTVLLEVAVDNAPAQKLYARNGFEPLGIRRGYYQPSNTDALVMERHG